MSDIRQLVLLSNTDLQSAPGRFRIVPWGKVTTAKGDFLVDEQAAKDVLAAFNAKGVDLCVDLEHQSLGGQYARADGAAPAQGWVRKLEAVPGEGIFACVDWTNEGRGRLTSRSYRYFSPVAIVGKTDNRLRMIQSCSLTNTPAMDHCDPLVAKDNPATSADRDVTDPDASDIPEKGVFVMNEKLLKLLALKEDASEEQVLDAVKALKEEKDKATDTLTKVCKSLGVDADASTADIDAKVLTLKSPAGSVDIKTVAELEAKFEATQAELKVLKAGADQRSAEELVSSWCQEGKLLKVQRDDAIKRVLSDRDGFTEFMATAPIVRQPGQTEPPADGGTTGGDRKTIIAKASREYSGDASAQKVCSERAWVNESLREKGKDPLSEDETKTLTL